MPRISAFYGIVIFMRYSERHLPHFHAEYGDDAALITIGSGQLYAGRMRTRALHLIAEWEALHRAELLANWERARSGLPLLDIDPLP